MSASKMYQALVDSMSFQLLSRKVVGMILFYFFKPVSLRCVKSNDILHHVRPWGLKWKPWSIVQSHLQTANMAAGFQFTLTGVKPNHLRAIAYTSGKVWLLCLVKIETCSHTHILQVRLDIPTCLIRSLSIITITNTNWHDKKSLESL